MKKLLIKFIVDNEDFINVIKKLNSEKDSYPHTIIRRSDGFFKNRDIMTFYVNNFNSILEEDDYEKFIIYTDDETMLLYVPFIDGKYNIEFKFSEYDKFISASELYPNLRRENNLMTMYHKRFFHDAFERYFK